MKKNNIVLKILIGTILISACFLVYMTQAQKNTTLSIEDTSGDRAYLQPFSFQGIAGELSGSEHFVLENGELHTRYYPINPFEMGMIVQEENLGNTGIKKYFGKYYTPLSHVREEVYTIPSAKAKRSMITTPQELTEENRDTLLATIQKHYPDIEDWSMSGYTTDTIKIYGDVSEGKKLLHTKFFTGLELSGDEFYFTKWKNAMKDMEVEENTDLGLHIATANLEHDIYAILATNAHCKGEVSLVQIPKENMVQRQWGSQEQDREEGQANILCTFSVNENQSIVGLMKVNEERLLLARTENDRLLLELYDTKGNLITQKDTGIADFSKYEVSYVQMLYDNEAVVVWFDLPQRRQMENEEDMSHFTIENTYYYLCNMDEIKALPVDGSADYVDYKNGTMLSIYRSTKSIVPECNQLFDFVSYGYDLKVQDADTGELLYEGILTGDFQKDYFRKLSGVNISKQAGPLEKRKNEVNFWEYDTEERYEIRYFGQLFPVHGVRAYTDWVNGGTMPFDFML